MSSPDQPQFGSEQERVVAIETASKLNELFKKGASAWDDAQVRLIRTMPRPIVIDFNGVLVNEERPWTPNPEAEEPLKKLVQIGSVFVITQAKQGWDIRHQALEDFKLWHPGMVLMTRENHATSGSFQQREAVIEDYSKIVGKTFDEFEEKAAFMFMPKRLAPLFGRPYDVPIIDNDSEILGHNPGMLPIIVRSFDNAAVPRGPKNFGDQSTKPSLADAVNIIEQHFISL